jgi:hypothetical protein
MMSLSKFSDAFGEDYLSPDSPVRDENLSKSEMIMLQVAMDAKLQDLMDEDEAEEDEQLRELQGSLRHHWGLKDEGWKESMDNLQSAKKYIKGIVDFLHFHEQQTMCEEKYLIKNMILYFKLSYKGPADGDKTAPAKKASPTLRGLLSILTRF